MKKVNIPLDDKDMVIVYTNYLDTGDDIAMDTFDYVRSDDMYDPGQPILWHRSPDQDWRILEGDTKIVQELQHDPHVLEMFDEYLNQEPKEFV